MQYDSNGNLTPSGKIEVDAEDFKRHFVDAYPESATRQRIYEGFQAYQETLLNVFGCNVEQWIDGSWVSNKQDPNDIDVVSLIDSEFIESDEVYFNKMYSNKLLTVFGSKDKFMVDAYAFILFPEDDPRYDLVTRKMMVYWDDWWSHDSDHNEKGYIVLKTQFQGGER